MLVGFAPGILIAVLFYLDKTDHGKTHINKENILTQQTIRTAPRAEARHSLVTKKPVTRQRKKSVEGDNDQIKYTFYLKLLRDEKIVGDRQIKRETKKYQLQLRKKKRAQLKRRQRKARLARNKKNSISHHKRSNQKKTNRRSKVKNVRRKVTENAKRKTRKLALKNRKKMKINQRKNKIATKPQKQVKPKIINTKKKSKPFPDYILIQAGSFRQKKQANLHRVKLATYGVDSVISSATIKGEIWYRVRVGPFLSYREMKSNLSKLRQKKIKVMPIRIGNRQQ